MKILALSDIHGDTSLVDLLAVPLKEVDLVLAAGDITNFGGADEIGRIIHALTRYNSQILAVHGNCDLPGAEKALLKMGITLDCRSKRIRNLQFMGIGGSLPGPGLTPNEMGESVFRDILDHFSGQDAEIPAVLVTHQPPYGTKIDAAPGGRHTGSRAIRRFIEEYQPILAVSGHIHEGRGVDRLGQTILVNPGPFRNGFYAVIEIEGRIVTADLHST